MDSAVQPFYELTKHWPWRRFSRRQYRRPASHPQASITRGGQQAFSSSTGESPTCNKYASKDSILPDETIAPI